MPKTEPVAASNPSSSSSAPWISMPLHPYKSNSQQTHLSDSPIMTVMVQTHNLCPKFLPRRVKFLTHSYPSIIHLANTQRIRISCRSSSSNRISDAELASDFATEVEKINTRFVQREEAMKKSSELLFAELCHFMGSKPEEAAKKWKKMDEEAKMVLVKAFVSEWGANFHPLSARSVKEVVDQHLIEEGSQSPDSTPAVFFRGLKQIMGFSSTN